MQSSSEPTANPPTSPPLPFHPENVIIVLVRPIHPGNIGSACRALKNMGLRQLRLVAPVNLDYEQARWLAAGADDVLQSAQVFQTLDEALADVQTVVGTTARDRHQRFPVLTARELPPWLLPLAKSNKVAILFGPEDFGLSNDDMGRCEALVRIPTSELSSLNLAQAVLVICYELMMAAPPAIEREEWVTASMQERERLVATSMRLVRRVDFMKARNLEQLQGKLRGMMGRLNLDSMEVGILLGLARKIFWHLEHPHVNKGKFLQPEDLQLSDDERAKSTE